MARLPKVGGDQGKWGNILNDFLSVEHNTDGTLKNSVPKTAKVNGKDFTGGDIDLSDTFEPKNTNIQGHINATADAHPMTAITGLSTTLSYHNAAVQQPARTNVIACVGDSITYGFAGDSVPVIPYPTLLNWKLDYLGYKCSVINFGRSGDKIADVVARVTGIINQNPSIAIILIGSNDLVSATPLATMQSGIISLTSALMGAGIRPVYCLALPRNDVALTTVASWNRWLSNVHAPMYGLQVIDTYTAFMNSDGTTNGTLLSDGRHPTANATDTALASTVTSALTATGKRLILPNDLPWVALGESNIGYPSFATDGNSDGVADGWTLGTSGMTATGSLVAHPTVGNWQQIATNGGSTMGNYASVYRASWQTLTYVGAVPGGDVMVGFDLDTNAMPGTTAYLKVRVQYDDGGGANISEPELLSAFNSSGNNLFYSTVSHARISTKVSVPATVTGGTTTSRMRLLFTVYGTSPATVRIGRLLFSGVRTW